ncbi:hypothetical protein BZG36_01047 [Bifiguratus adelaidae]|uniref:Uncharacterized protein n=1 Tax=Bifiguratus adelaidae TaxID=1938954 RepID=A0A261Y675_9FUNG|nr:hypothetical protein BZG36_01047 [Bifiguratus adelaidae]
MPSKTNDRRKGSDANSVAKADPRFAHVHKDPRFRRAKKKENKIALDSRFSGMLKGGFTNGPKVDKYGRKLQATAHEDELKRYYKLEDEEEEESASSSEEEEEEEKEEEEESDEDLSLEELEKRLGEDEENLKDEELVTRAYDTDSESEEEGQAYDPMRGEGVMSSSDESDSEEETKYDDEEEEEEQIPRGEETRRFAVVNLDWEHVKSADLFKVFNGFKPDSSIIKSVKIYPSEFGKERMAREATEGPPKEIFRDSAVENGDDEEEEEVTEKTLQLEQADEGNEFDMDALRRYQLDRLRYYYAVVECDSVATARAIYNACDGTEYESSANFFDLRYIPDDMTFDDEPRDEAYRVADGYKPATFVTDALQHSNVKLTWDDDDPDRIKVTRRKLTKEDIKDLDFAAYLASSSDESDDGSFIQSSKDKYRSLLNGLEEEEGGEAGEMEITFAPGLSEAAAEAVDRKLSGKENKGDETTLEAYLRKQKEKRQKKKEATVAAKSSKKEVEEEDEVQEKEQLFSDDDVDFDASDPFFTEEMANVPAKANKEKAPKAPKASKSKKNRTKEERLEDARKKAELELLMEDADGKGDGFDYKEVLKREKLMKRKGKKAKLAAQADAEDDFTIDTADPRFAAMHESHHFAIDPTNPHFKKTKAMEKLMKERRRRQQEASNGSTAEWTVKPASNPTKKDTSLSALVDTVKRKAALATEPNREGKRKKAKY